MLLAHDLLLLLLDDESGRLHSANVRQELLGGALLIELAAGGWVDVAGAGEQVRAGRIVCRPVAAPADPILAAALDRLAALQGKRPEAVLRPLGRELPEQLTADLVDAGLVRAEAHKVLGVFASTRYPAAADGYELQLRDRLAAVLAGQEPADARTGPLIVILGATGLLPKVVPVESRRRARKVAKALAGAEWAAASVRRAVLAANSAASAALATSA